ncbi:MAG: AAA family ATPase [Thiobacillus sp.]|nr:AAA family ATPase [Thiobacillus sp.]
MLGQRAGGEAKPADWCYVHNFSQPHKPRAIQLPAGMGTRFQADMQQPVAELQAMILERRRIALPALTPRTC